MNEDQPLAYVFSDTELKTLASFFRRNAPLPDILYSFNGFIENYIYQNLTIDEAERVYSVQ